jgi:hypothetical protein
LITREEKIFHAKPLSREEERSTQCVEYFPQSGVPDSAKSTTRSALQMGYGCPSDLTMPRFHTQHPFPGDRCCGFFDFGSPKQKYRNI